MTSLFKLFILFMLFTLPGCQFLAVFKTPFNHNDKPDYPVKVDSKQDPTLQLLALGNKYSAQSEQQQHALCKQLKLEYETQKEWQKAWLLIYSLNSNFNCISMSKSLHLLQSIQKPLKSEMPLYWLNNKQIQLLKSISYLQVKNKKIKLKNSHLKDQLNKVESQLQEITSKIQALKIIETTINQNTQ